MLAARLVLVLILLALSSFAPGFFVVRRFRWSPMEKLCGAIGLSLILIYLAAWAIYLCAPANQSPFYCAVSALCVAAAVVARRDALRLMAARRVRQALGGFGFLFGWSVLLLSMIRNYSGAGWSADWLEHFQRSLFFLQRFPTATKIFPGYMLPARPPLMNVLGAFYLGQTVDRFEIFQLVFVFLNLLLFLACFLMLPALARRGGRHRKWVALPLVGIFAASPLIMESTTYTWTKALASFFVVLAVWFYLAARRKHDAVRMTAAFLLLAAGMLTHYSAGPYVVFLALHYLIVAFRQRGYPWREVATIAVLCSLLLATWFGWSLATYGTHDTLASNTSVTSSAQYEGSNLEKIGANLFDSVVPGALRDASLMHLFDQPNAIGYLRDNLFILFQTNLLFTMGATGGLLAVALWFGLWRRKAEDGRETSFWRLFVPCLVLLGIAVVGERDLHGSAHLTLLPLESLGLTWLAAEFRRRRVVAAVVLAGMLIDFPLGVMLQMRVENLENTPQHTYFAGLVDDGKTLSLGHQRGPDGLSGGAWGNWMQKHQYRFANEWMQQLDQYRQQSARLARAVPRIWAFVKDLAAEDPERWQGWYSRHGGEISFFGDAFGENWAATGLLGLLWAGLLWRLWLLVPPRAAAVKATANTPAPKPRRRAANRKAR